MKKIVIFLITVVAAVILAAGGVCADNIFSAEIEKAVDNAIPAWIFGDPKKLSAAIEKLALNEAYCMAIGKSLRDGYLSNVPMSLNKNFNAVAAYLFFMRKQKEGVSMWTKSFFEGQRFEFYEKGER